MAEHPVRQCQVAVIWIDWYPYHVARFDGINAVPRLAGRTVGIELVGGVGVHTGLKFREDLPPDLPVHTLMPKFSWAEANRLKLAGILWRQLSRLAPRVVLIPGYYTLPALAAAIWARMHDSTSVLMTESTAADHVRSGGKERLKSIGLRLLYDWAVCGGKSHVQYLHQLGFPAHRIAGSYDVVDNDFFSSGTLEIRASTVASAYALPVSPYFLYVGRLAEEKNVSGLIQSWLAYRACGGTWPIVLAGDGPKAASLRALVQASPYAGDVLFTGLRSSEQLLPLYAFAGCFILPSTREPWGLVVNEAMASALPVLVSARCGCARDLVRPSRNGFTFEPSDHATLTNLLHQMSNLSPEQRSAIGRSSVEIIAGYSPGHFGRSVATIVDAAERSAPIRSASQHEVSTL